MHVESSPKLPGYFNGTAIYIFTALVLSVLSKNLDLNLNDSESVMLLSGSSLQYCHTRSHVFK